MLIFTSLDSRTPDVQNVYFHFTRYIIISGPMMYNCLFWYLLILDLKCKNDVRTFAYEKRMTHQETQTILG